MTYFISNFCPNIVLRIVVEFFNRLIMCSLGIFILTNSNKRDLEQRQVQNADQNRLSPVPNT